MSQSKPPSKVKNRRNVLILKPITSSSRSNNKKRLKLTLRKARNARSNPRSAQLQVAIQEALNFLEEKLEECNVEKSGLQTIIHDNKTKLNKCKEMEFTKDLINENQATQIKKLKKENDSLKKTKGEYSDYKNKASIHMIDLSTKLNKTSVQLNREQEKKKQDDGRWNKHRKENKEILKENEKFRQENNEFRQENDELKEILRRECQEYAEELANDHIEKICGSVSEKNSRLNAENLRFIQKIKDLEFNERIMKKEKESLEKKIKDLKENQDIIKKKEKYRNNILDFLEQNVWDSKSKSNIRLNVGEGKRKTRTKRKLKRKKTKRRKLKRKKSRRKLKRKKTRRKKLKTRRKRTNRRTRRRR